MLEDFFFENRHTTAPNEEPQFLSQLNLGHTLTSPVEHGGSITENLVDQVLPLTKRERTPLINWKMWGKELWYVHKKI